MCRNGTIQPSKPQYVRFTEGGALYVPNFPSTVTQRTQREEGGYLKSNLPVASRSSPSARYNTTFRSTRSRSSNASSAPLVHRMSKETSIPSSCVANNNIDPGGNVSGMLISEKGPSPSEPS